MTEKSLEQQLEDLASFRNFETPAPFNPLRDFWGILAEFKTEYNETYNTTYGYLGFTDLEVLESETPYDLPITELRFPINKRRTTRWTILGDSAVEFLEEDQDVRDMIGMKVHMQMRTFQLYDGNIKKMTPQLAWEMVGVEGVAQKAKPVDAMERAIVLLDGNTLAKFNQAAMVDAVIRSDSAVQAKILDKSLVEGLVVLGVVTMDEDGVYHKADVPA